MNLSLLVVAALPLLLSVAAAPTSLKDLALANGFVANDVMACACVRYKCRCEKIAAE
jgi:hypothetical protein